MQEKICTFAPVMKRIVFYSKKSVCIGLAAVALQASAADNERATCSDLSLGTSEKFTAANGLLADSSRVYDIDEVVVVSQPKENFRLRQQPLSSTSFGSYQMQRLGSRDLRELSCYVPNFVMPNYGSRFTNAMYVRGIGSRINSPAVGIYLDGIPVLSKAAFNLHHYQTSRIDILRGPQGTLYGQNSEGGLVRIYSRDAYDSKGTYVNLGLGSHFYRNVEAAHYMKLSPRIALGVAAFYDGQKGFFHRAGTSDYADNYDEAGGKFNLKFRFDRGWSMDLLANYQFVYQHAFPYGQLDLNSGKAVLPNTTFPGLYRRNMLLSGVNLRHEGAKWDFASTTSYQFLDDNMKMDQDYLPEDYLSLQQDQLQNSITQEFTFKSRQPFFGFWHLTQGAFFSHVWLKTNGPVKFGSELTNPISNVIQQQMYSAIHSLMVKQMMGKGMKEPAANAAATAAIEKAGGISMAASMGAPGLFHTPQSNLGLYHESTFDLSSRLKATLGLRYDFMHTSIHYDTYAYMAMTAKVMGKEATYTLRSMLDRKTSDDYNQLLPKFGLSYQLDEQGSNVYATVSKGYRAGGYNIQMFSDILQTELNAHRQDAMGGDYDVAHTDEDYDRVNQTIAFKPETSWNYEVGTHLNLFDHRLHFDLSAFYMQVRNQQLSVMAGTYGFGRMMVNAGKSHSCGIEAALKGQAFDGAFDWGVNYGFTRAVFDEYTDGEGDKAVSYKDKKVPYVPQHTIAAMADYHLGQFTFGLNMNAQGKTYWDNANTYSQKMYFVMGAHCDIDFSKMSISIWGKNLTDTNYNTFAVDNAATGKKLYFAQRGNPFQCGVDLKFHF